MRLTRLVLDGYRRLALSGIHHLDWTPTSPYQMILGTNGSGKSSLMAECSPLPAAANDYLKGGSKRAEWEHDHATYVVTSTFGTTARHSFVRDGVELNEGGTGAIQKELVETHFHGYTKDIHDILTGRSRFTTMSPAERRKYITKMSHSDYTFALAFHDRVKTAARDMQGYLNRIKQRLHDETLALDRMAEVDGIEERVKTLQTDLTDLLYARTPAELTPEVAARQMTQQIAALERTGTALIKAASQIDPVGTDRSAQALERVIGALENDIRVQSGILDRLRVEYSDLETLWRSLDATDTVDVSTVDATVGALRQRIATAQSSIEVFPALLTVAHPAAMLATTEEILSRLMALFTQLPDNSHRHISRDNVEKARTSIRDAQGVIDKAESTIRILKQRLHVIEHAAFQTCPQCAHRWAPGVEVAEAPELQAKVEAWQTQASHAETTRQQAQQYLEEAEAYMGLFRQWRGFVQQYPDLALLWEHIQQHQYDTDHPGDHGGVFTTWLSELTTVTHLRRWEEEIGRLAAAAAAAQSGQGRQVKLRLLALEEEIGQRTATHADLQQRVASLNLQRQLFHTLEASVETWQAAVLDLEGTYQRALEALATDRIDRDVTRIQGQLGALQHTLNAKQALLNIIEDLKRTTESAALDHAALAMIVQELSPKEGLIAEQMHTFIKRWVAQVNAFIRPVWTYDLEMLPCEMAHGDLTYRFPVYASATEQRSSDVADTSTSIEQIINFAFQQTLVLYLGMKDVPLFVDELGANFDVQHRLNLYPFLARLMETGQYSQLFMISHYEAGWGAFNGAEYLVLDGRNIAVPDHHNHHVILS